MAHSVALSWTASLDTVDSYNVYRGPAGAEAVKINTSPIVGTSFTDSAPPLGSSSYIAKSVVAGVESVASNEVTAVILPAPPTLLKITASS
jgi:fibronectin type 3 domain-containing protein